MKISICAIIKDEHRFLEEWIEWHLGIGFDAIHLFEDKGSKSHEEICEKYSNVYLRRYENDNELREIIAPEYGNGKQVRLYNWFLDTYKDKTDWVAFIDVDEFFFFEKEWDLNRLCLEFINYPAVHLFWKMKGASWYLKRPSCGVVEAYTEDAPFIKTDMCGWISKSFVNVRLNKGMKTCHHANEGVCTDYSTDISIPIYGKAWINHYFSKSWEDWCDRIFNRGDIYQGHRTLVDFFECNPAMEFLREELLYSVADRRPNGTYWIDKKKGLIAGGNVRKIMALNGTPIIPITWNKANSKDDALNSAIAKAMRLGLNSYTIDKSKLIHFCWFGGAPLPKLIMKCIESWKKYMPEYTYCLWTEDSFDVTSHTFTDGAYKDKAWAFVADYVRLWVIYSFGGIYFDTDVELLADISDFPSNWLAIERDTDHVALGLGFAAEKGSDFILNHLIEYDSLVWDVHNKNALCSPGLTGSYMNRMGYIPNFGEIDKYNGFTIYPTEYMCPMSYLSRDVILTNKTRAIHHYTNTWH